MWQSRQQSSPGTILERILSTQYHPASKICNPPAKSAIQQSAIQQSNLPGNNNNKKKEDIVAKNVYYFVLLCACYYK